MVWLCGDCETEVDHPSAYCPNCKKVPRGIIISPAKRIKPPQTNMNLIKIYVRGDWLTKHNLTASDTEAAIYQHLVDTYSDPGDI